MATALLRLMAAARFRLWTKAAAGLLFWSAAEPLTVAVAAISAGPMPPDDL